MESRIVTAAQIELVICEHCGSDNIVSGWLRWNCPACARWVSMMLEIDPRWLLNPAFEDWLKQFPSLEPSREGSR